MPDPPAYYKQFVNDSQDIRPPDIQRLLNKNYRLRYFDSMVVQGFQDYINFMSNDFNMSQEVMKQQAFEKSNLIKELTINAMHFLNKLRRKQAIINLKNELESSMKKRNMASENMIRQIKESIEIINEGLLIEERENNSNSDNERIDDDNEIQI
ncbi:protein kinase domain containing protein [Stylonychia lemnae]|uniref:Protein kinase domain containing protein n=1 Tax=Stylonychia lemnae TaxID=5949 RepID=A0A078ARK3_STYLE|nr:protein kinase domain containing protein [Stylonychia lemnae]|eukprot:CDW84611.1 protein kinase domain containing protein [Stylonychia lemnae]